MPKKYLELSKKIQRCANRGVRKVYRKAKQTGIPVVYVEKGELKTVTL